MSGHADCERRGADPQCYGCLGTGKVKWAGVDPNTVCSCTFWCDTHDAQCFAPWHERTEEEIENA